MKLRSYKGYHAKVKIDFETQEFYGEIDGISDYVDFISDMKDGMTGIIREFHSAVDDYIEICHAVGKTSPLQATLFSFRP